MKPSWRTTLLLVAFGLSPGLAQAKDLELTSAWLGAPGGDASATDVWAGHLVPLDDLPILFGVQNDAHYVYVCVRTSDPMLKRQLARLGLTLWADGEAKDRRGYGVRYPLARGSGRPGDRGTPPGTAPRADSGTPGDMVGGAEMELIGPTETDRLVVPASGSDPVRVSMRDDSGVTVIEIRLPLEASDEHPLAVGTAPGRTIALGLETEAPRMGRGGSGWGGGAGGARRGGEGEPGEGAGGEGRGGFGGDGWGGRGGGGLGPRGGMGRGFGDERGPMATPIKVWTRVTLALPPTPAPH